MKICLVHGGGITPIVAGGIGSVITNIVNQTIDNVEYTLLTGFNSQDMKEAESIYPPSVQIISLRTSRNFIMDSIRFLKKGPYDKFDIVHFHDFPMGRELFYFLKLWLNKFKLIHSYHITKETYLKNKIIIGSYYFLFKQFWEIWSKIIINSEFMFNDITRFNYNENKTVIIPNGVNIKEIQSAKRIFLKGDPSILFIGHLELRKGIDLLVNAFKKFKKNQQKAHLHIVGSGSLERYCREFVSSNNLEECVHFWGVLGNLRFNLLKSCDICVFPSRYEAYGIVLLEAMAAGKPIISTRVGGIPEIIAHQKNGILVKPDSGQLSWAMQFLLDRKDIMEHISNNNLQDVLKYSWKEISYRYYDLYKSVISDL